MCTRCRCQFERGDVVVVLSWDRPTSTVKRDLTIERRIAHVELPYHERCAP